MQEVSLEDIIRIITAFKNTPRLNRGDELNADMSSSFGRGNRRFKPAEDVMEKIQKYEHPENLGCTYIDQNGKLCAAIGCWAKTLLENSEDLGNTPEAKERRKRIIEKAIKAGCKQALEQGTKINHA